MQHSYFIYSCEYLCSTFYWTCLFLSLSLTTWKLENKMHVTPINTLCFVDWLPFRKSSRVKVDFLPNLDITIHLRLGSWKKLLALFITICLCLMNGSHGCEYDMISFELLYVNFPFATWLDCCFDKLKPLIWWLACDYVAALCLTNLLC